MHVQGFRSCGYMFRVSGHVVVSGKVWCGCREERKTLWTTRTRSTSMYAITSWGSWLRMEQSPLRTCGRHGSMLISWRNRWAWRRPSSIATLLWTWDGCLVILGWNGGKSFALNQIGRICDLKGIIIWLGNVLSNREKLIGGDDQYHVRVRSIWRDRWIILTLST